MTKENDRWPTSIFIVVGQLFIFFKKKTEGKKLLNFKILPFSQI
jgi:hypothetical protein